MKVVRCFALELRRFLRPSSLTRVLDSLTRASLSLCESFVFLLFPQLILSAVLHFFVPAF